MAKMVKKHSSKQGWFSKGLNIGLVLLGFSRPIQHLIALARGRTDALEALTYEATFGLIAGKLDWKAGARMYSPVGAAVSLGYLKSYLLKKFPVRR